MADLSDLTEDFAENKTKPKRRGRRWIFADFVKKGVLYTIAFSLFVFAVYLAGSIPDPGFSDRMLFLLLRLLQYTSLLLCAFSLFALGYRVRRMVYRPSVRNGLRVGFFFATAVLGAGFAMLNSMIIAVARGHG